MNEIGADQTSLVFTRGPNQTMKNKGFHLPKPCVLLGKTWIWMVCGVPGSGYTSTLTTSSRRRMGITRERGNSIKVLLGCHMSFELQ